MESRRRRPSSTATRRLCSLLALAGDYLKYIFMKRRRLFGRVARRTLALINHHGSKSSKHLAPSWPRPLMEHEFSCSNSPSPAFLAAKRLRSRLKRGASVSSCFGALRASFGSPPPATEERAEGEVEEEEEEVDELDVDYRAEEFINRFYEQLRAQSFPALFQCSP